MRDRVWEEAELRLEYIEIVDADRLVPVNRVEGPVVVALAAQVGETRLIDNVRLSYL